MAVSVDRDRERFGQLGIELIPPVRGTEHLLALIASRRANAIVFPADWRRFRNAFAAMDTPSVIRELVRDDAGPQKAVTTSEGRSRARRREALRRSARGCRVGFRPATRRKGIGARRWPVARSADSAERSGTGFADGDRAAQRRWRGGRADVAGHARLQVSDARGAVALLAGRRSSAMAGRARPRLEGHDADVAEIEPLTDEEAKRLLAEELELLSISSEGDER